MLLVDLKAGGPLISHAEQTDAECMDIDSGLCKRNGQVVERWFCQVVSGYAAGLQGLCVRDYATFLKDNRAITSLLLAEEGLDSWPDPARNKGEIVT